MTASDLPDLGRRIREERQARGVGLRELARAVGVSASMVSQIENGRSRPSVSTLFAITTELGISIDRVFPYPSGEPPLEPAGEVPGAVPHAAGPGPGVRPGPVLRPAERHSISLEAGVRWERLGEVPGQQVDFLRVTYPPGATSSRTGELMRHAGTEYGVLISGELVLTLGPDEVTLGPGDSAAFDSSTPHRLRNDGTEDAVGIWCVVES